MQDKWKYRECSQRDLVLQYKITENQQVLKPISRHFFYSVLFIYLIYSLYVWHKV